MLIPDIQHDLIITIVKKGLSEQIVKASRSAGAEGATIIPGRGTGIHERHVFFGIPIEPEKDIILTVIGDNLTDVVLDSIIKAGELNRPGTGITFVLELKKVAGIVHLVQNLEEDSDSTQPS